MAGNATLPGQRPELDTGILDVIMGKSDSLTMKEKLAYAVDQTNDVESRIEALDDFEMVSRAAARHPIHGRGWKLISISVNRTHR